MGLPANGEHHGVVLEAPEQTPLRQCGHNPLPGHKPVKALAEKRQQ